MNPRSSHTITHGLFVCYGVREPQAVCQAAQSNAQTKAWQRVCLSQRTPKLIDKPTDGKEHRSDNSVYVAIAGEVVNRRSVLLRNFVLNGQVSASNTLLHIHPNR